MNNESIVLSIKKLCKENNITVGQLEKEVGLSQGLVSKWANTSPSFDKIIDIANYFHTSLDEVVGRNESNINDEFIKLLYDKTASKEIEWNIFDKTVDESGIKQYSEDFSYFSPIDEEDCINFYESHKQISYYFQYTHGFISIYAMYEYHNVTKPKDLKLFIQPDIQAELIEQSFEQSELLSLWLKILISLKDKAPDEIRAEDLKNSFINQFKNKEIPKKKMIFVTNTYDKQINQIMKYKGCVLYDIKFDAILDENEITDVTHIAKEFYYKYKETMGKVRQALLKNGKNLILISDNYFMKLSGFSWGKSCGMTGYNGLMEILNDAGFDTSDHAIFSKDNFVLFPSK